MREVGIRELKNDTSTVVSRAEAGETIVVTRRGRPVARLSPATEAADIPPDIQRLIDEGRATWNGRKPRLPKRVKLAGDGPLASDYVSEGRR